MQRGPRRCRIERRVKELLDPCGVQVFRPAIPCVAQRPDTPRGGAGRRRLCTAHVDFAGDCAALRRRPAREFSLPRPHGRRRDLDEIKIRRPAMPLARLGRDASIGRDQRKLAFERRLCGEDDTQRRALPRRDRRGEDREPGRVFAAAGRTLGPCVRYRDEKCACDQQQCFHSSKPAGRKQAVPLWPPSSQLNDIM